MDGQLIGSFLQKLRKEHQLTQKDIAKLCHVSNQAVSKWEKGDSIPDIETLETLSILYKLTINELLDGEKHEVYMDLNKRKTIISLCLAVFPFIAFFFVYAIVDLDIEAIFGGAQSMTLTGYELIFKGTSGMIVWFVWIQFLLYLFNVVFLIFTLTLVIKRTVLLNHVFMMMHVVLISIALFGLFAEVYTPITQIILLFVSSLSLMLLPEAQEEQGFASEITQTAGKYKQYQKHPTSFLLNNDVKKTFYYQLYRTTIFLSFLVIAFLSFFSFMNIIEAQSAHYFVLLIYYILLLTFFIASFKYIKTTIGFTLRYVYAATLMTSAIGLSAYALHEYLKTPFNTAPPLIIGLSLIAIIGILVFYGGHRLKNNTT